MAIFTRRKSRTYAILKPCIIKAVAHIYSTTAIGHSNIIATTEFM